MVTPASAGKMRTSALETGEDRGAALEGHPVPGDVVVAPPPPIGTRSSGVRRRK
jgi:hypothetical protein